MLKRSRLFVFVLAAALSAWAATVTEEFHQTYSLAANGKVAVHNVNGAVQVTAWDRNEVKVDAVKRGPSKEDIDQVRIEVDAQPGSVEIRTKYPEHSHNNHGSVDYAITVPRSAAIDSVNSVNGNVTVEGVSGPVHATAVNGKVEVRKSAGDLNLSTVNGRVDADLEASARKAVLSTVNGSISIALSAAFAGRLHASTVHGDISSDFDIPVRHAGSGPGTSVDTTIGSGNGDVKLSTVNGPIKLSRK